MFLMSFTNLLPLKLFMTILGRFLIVLFVTISLKNKNVDGHYTEECSYFSNSSDLDVVNERSFAGTDVTYDHDIHF